MLHRVSISCLATLALVPGSAIAQTPAPTQPTSPPAVTTVLPADAAGVLFINTSTEAWGELNRFNPLPMLSQALLLAPPIAKGSGIDDLQSWLGNPVAIALLPTRSNQETFGSSAVLLAPVKDKPSLNRFLDGLKANRGKPTVEREYKGVTIWEWSLPRPAAEPDPKDPSDSSPENPSKEPRIPSAPNSPPKETLQPTLRLAPSWAEQPQSSASLVSSSRDSAIASPVFPPALLSASPTAIAAVAKPGPKPLPGTFPPIPTAPIPDPAKLLKPRGFAIAILPDTLAVATQGAALEKLIDAQAAGTPLAKHPLFQRTAQHPQFGRSLMTGYADYAGILKLINQWIQVPSDPTQPNSPRQPLLSDKQVEFFTKRYSTFDVLTWVRPDGIYSQSNVYYTTPQPDKTTPTSPELNQILTRLPANTFVSANSHNFKQQWQEFVELSGVDLESQRGLEQIRKGIRSFTGLDLDRDIVAWMDGQYALFFFPTRGGLLNAIDPRINLGMAVMIQTSDRRAAEAALKTLDEKARSSAKGGLTITNRLIKGQLVTSWEGQDHGRSISLFSHNWLSQDTLLITTGAGAAADLTPKPYQPLNLSYTFKAATGSFPAPNDGYFYLNTGSTLSFVANLVRAFSPQTGSSFYFEEGLRILGTLRSISSTQVSTPEKIQADTLWVLSPTRK